MAHLAANQRKLFCEDGFGNNLQAADFHRSVRRRQQGAARNQQF
jgi:hypothetical protein